MPRSSSRCNKRPLVCAQDTTADQWDKTFDINVKAPFLLSQEIIPIMKKVTRPRARAPAKAFAHPARQPRLRSGGG